MQDLKAVHFYRTSAIWAVMQSMFKSCILTTRARPFRSEETLTPISSMGQAWIIAHKPKKFVDSSKTKNSHHGGVLLLGKL